MIKQKLFILETLRDGDAELISVLIANSGYSCESSSGGEDDQLDLSGNIQHMKSIKHSELNKSPGLLLAEVSALIRSVTNGSVWPQLGNSDYFADETATNQVQLVNDAFKEAFLS